MGSVSSDQKRSKIQKFPGENKRKLKKLKEMETKDERDGPEGQGPSDSSDKSAGSDVDGKNAVVSEFWNWLPKSSPKMSQGGSSDQKRPKIQKFLEEHEGKLKKLKKMENKDERDALVDSLVGDVNNFRKKLAEFEEGPSDSSDKSAGSDVDGKNADSLDTRQQSQKPQHSKLPSVTVRVMRTINSDLRGADEALWQACKYHGNVPKLEFKNAKQLDMSKLSVNEVCVLVCPILDRLGASVDSAIRSVSGAVHPKVALVLFHHQAPHNSLVVESDQLLVADQYKNIGCMVDVVFWQNSGMYQCESNCRARDKLVKFFWDSCRV